MTGQICIVASPKRAQFQGGRTVVIIGLLQPSAFAVAMGISLLLQQLHAFAVTGGVTLPQGFFSLKSLFFFRLISKADLYYYPTFSCKSCRCLYAYRRPKKKRSPKKFKVRKCSNSKIRKISNNYFGKIPKWQLHYNPFLALQQLYAYRRPKKNEVRKSSKFRKYLNSKIRKIFKLFWQNSKMGNRVQYKYSKKINFFSKFYRVEY